MQSSAPPEPWWKTHRTLVLAIVVFLVCVGALAAALVALWYPTTKQPNVQLTNATYAREDCVPFNGYFGNRYNWTFTLVNTGTADGTASIGFMLNGMALGYRYYPVAQHSQLTDTAPEYGYTYATVAECRAAPPETPGLSLASVSGGLVLDRRFVLQSLIVPMGTLGLTGAMLAFLQHGARRRGFSVLADLGSSGWAEALLIVFAAGLLSNFVVLVLTTPFDAPGDWLPAIAFGAIWTVMAVFLFAVAYREAMRQGPRRPPVPR